VNRAFDYAHTEEQRTFWGEHYWLARLGPKGWDGVETGRPSTPVDIRHLNPPNPGHPHPRIRYPRPRDEVYDQLQSLREQAGLRGHPMLSWPSSLARLHEKNARRYAQVYFPGGERFAGNGDARYELAEQARWLPAPHLRGVLAHEVGHELAGPEGSEADADAAVEGALGLKLSYDRRWPGKGLQRANPWEWQRAHGGEPYPDTLSGAEVTRLMRHHGVTIRDLARGMQVTQKRVRYVRQHGVTPCSHGRTCRGCVQTWLDWIQRSSRRPNPTTPTARAW
jgi:hypothetical protein